MDAEITKAIRGLPGTGKTTALMGILADEVDAGTRPSDIAASTYRVDMADEFEQAATHDEKLPGDRPAPLDPEELPDDHWMGTTHSLCYRLHGYQDVVTEGDRHEFCAELGIGYDGGWRSTEPEAETGNANTGDLAFQAREYCINIEVDPVTEWRQSNLSEHEKLNVSGSRTDFEHFNRQYENWKEENGLIDFNDMLLTVRDQELVPPVDVLIEDEFQDKTPLQVSIFEQWSQEIDRVYVAGDRFQAIYQHTGTDPKFMQQAHETAEESVTLGTSYRFGTTLWDYATYLLERVGYDVPEIEPVGNSEVEKLSYGDYRQAVESHRDEDCLHLVRANYMASKPEMLLEQLGLPFSSVGAAEWTPRVVTLYNATTKLAHTLRSFQSRQTPAVLSLDHITAQELSVLVESLRSTMQSGTKVGNVERMERVNDPEEPESYADVDPRSVLDTRNLAAGIEWDAPFSTDVFTKQGIGSESIGDRLNAAYRQLDGEQIDEINHRIKTIHGSKGMEATNVFLFDGIPPAVDEAEGPFVKQSKTEARNFFVGATRTEDNLYVIEFPDEKSIEL